MTYRIVFEKTAEKYLRRQEKTTQTRLLKAISVLPDIGDVKKLVGKRIFSVYVWAVSGLFFP